MSKKRRRPIQVLMIDDDQQFASPFIKRARKYQVLITNKTNLQEGLHELQNNSKYQAVILDGKAPIHPQQAKGTEAENFVHEAIMRLREMELRQERPLPFCVHTAWKVQLEPSLRQRAALFDKKKTAVDEDEMQALFEFLHQEVGQLENSKIKQQFPEVFDFADRYLDQEDVSLLLSILADKSMAKREQMLERLAFVRRLEESILNVFCREALKVDPLLYGMDGQSRTKDLIELIKVRKLAPMHVSFLTYIIYATLSSIVQHKAPESSEYYNYPITPYTVKTFINGLLDIILWVKDSIENGLREGSIMHDFQPPR